MKFDISKLLNISARIAGAIVFACVFILFFPSKWLPFNISEFRIQNGLWVFVVMVVAISLYLSYAVKWISEKIKKKIELQKTWKSYKHILQNLSSNEKEFIREHYNRKETAIYINLSNPMMKKLQTFQIISMAAGTSVITPTSAPGFIQPWVFKVIDKHPEILTEEDKPND